MQFFRRNRYRFFYPAGLISLVLLPLFCFFYLYKKDSFQGQNVFDLRLKVCYDVYPDSIKLVNIDIGKDKIENKRILAEAQSNLRQFNIERVKTTGVNLSLNNGANYQDLINVLDVCHSEKVDILSIGKGTLAFNYGPEFPYKYQKEVKSLNLKERFYSILHDFTISIEQTKSFWPAGILYIIMISLTTQKVVRQLRNQQRTTSN